MGSKVVQDVNSDVLAVEEHQPEAAIERRYRKMLVTAVIPCYNEELTISDMVKELLRFEFPVTVIVVNNNSTDKTAENAKKAGARVVSEKIAGKGAAVRKGLVSIPPETTHVFLVDGDGTYSLSQIRSGLDLMEKDSIDMIVGKRIAVDEHLLPKSSFPRFHVFGNLFLTKVFRILFRSKITDSLSGWRLMSRPFVDSFNGTSHGFQVESELNSHAHALDVSVLEIDIEYSARPIGSFSKLNTFKDGFRILRRNIQIFKNDSPLLAFLVLGLPWLAASTYFLIRVLVGWGSFQEVRLPSVLFLIASFLVFLNLWATGIVLERIAQLRKTQLRSEYKRSLMQIKSRAEI